MPDTTPDDKNVKTSAPAKKTSRATTARKAAVKSAATAKPAAKGATAKVAQPKRQPPAAKKAAVAKPAPAAKDAQARKPKQKLVRDSFTMPSDDFQLIDQLKDRAIGFKRPAKKSELLRAGLHALIGLNDAALKAALDGLAPLKPGRPKKTPA